MRVNTECLCVSSNDLLAGDLTYREAGTRIHTYSLADEAKAHNGQAWNGVAITARQVSGHDFAHLVVPNNQHFAFNSEIFAVTPGTPFTLRMPLGSVNGKGMAGSAIVIWFDENRHGIQRSHLFLRSDPSDVIATKTDDNGQFRMTMPQVAVGRPALAIEFEGDKHWRGAAQRLSVP
jgi:hypothetical protein